MSSTKTQIASNDIENPKLSGRKSNSSTKKSIYKIISRAKSAHNQTRRNIHNPAVIASVLKTDKNLQKQNARMIAANKIQHAWRKHRKVEKNAALKSLSKMMRKSQRSFRSLRSLIGGKQSLIGGKQSLIGGKKTRKSKK